MTGSPGLKHLQILLMYYQKVKNTFKKSGVLTAHLTAPLYKNIHKKKPLMKELLKCYKNCF